MLFKHGEKPGNKRASRIASIVVKEFMVLKPCAGSALEMDRPLERDLIIRVHARIPGQRRECCFEVHKINGIGQFRDDVLEMSVVIGFVFSDAVAGSLLHFA